MFINLKYGNSIKFDYLPNTYFKHIYLYVFAGTPHKYDLVVMKMNCQ